MSIESNSKALEALIPGVRLNDNAAFRALVLLRDALSQMPLEGLNPNTELLRGLMLARMDERVVELASEA